MVNTSEIDFIGIGAPKCGTTWLSAQLEAHPQIGFAPDKEVYYFADTIARRIAGQELRCFDRGVDWYHKQFPQLAGTIQCRGEFCPAYLYSEEAAARIADYRPDIKLLLCVRPPVEMIYSWYWYGGSGVVTSLPKFDQMMENSFLRDLGCFGRHLKPYLTRFSSENFLVVRLGAIQRDPDRVRQRVYEFLGVTAEFKPHVEVRKNEARAARSPVLQAATRRLYAGVSKVPGVNRFLKSPAISRMLQHTYHRINSKARKYEPLPPEERAKWESYYAADQEELSRLLQTVEVIE